MKRALIACAVLACVISTAIALAAPKTYQFTGTVKTADKDTFTVEKSATETWTFSTDAATKGTPKVGDKVTVNYKMVATSIEAKTGK
jgi:uncharacterized protein YxeA